VALLQISSSNAEGGAIEASGKVEIRVLTDDANFCEQGFAIFHEPKTKSSCSALTYDEVANRGMI